VFCDKQTEACLEKPLVFGQFTSRLFKWPLVTRLLGLGQVRAIWTDSTGQSNSRDAVVDFVTRWSELTEILAQESDKNPQSPALDWPNNGRSNS
jgi:hypothetical protein